MAANLDVSGHPAARRVLDTLSRSVASEASTVRLGPVLRRRDFGKVTVENAHCLDVTALVRELPRGSRVFVRDSEGAVASRVQVCFPLSTYRAEKAAFALAALAAVLVVYVYAF